MGRILGLDFGTKRIGVAISDSGRKIASPVEVYERRNDKNDAAHFRALIEEDAIDRIVIGLPVHTTGNEGQLADLARSFGKWLREVADRPVFFFDERFTTADAEEILRDAGLKTKDRKAKRDMLAARLLLQNYLDAGCPETEAPSLPLDD